ncbi:unnamed protein product [Ceutorhynchus assimilis]|uniref:Uncharacterized protein n=1 Tax=Ceutorhynchus assimilis TaxID=467358 RepID=A0A9N9MIW7_9CUCU|nr:unnamed protein product [Ceutorhynchus assimilis]
MDNLLECRTCLGMIPRNETVHVETEIMEEKSVLQAIKDIASLEVTETDTFPNQICQICYQTLESALVFRIQIITSNIELGKRNQIGVFNDSEIIIKESKEIIVNNGNTNHIPDLDSEVKDESEKIINNVDKSEESGSDWNINNDDDISSDENDKPKRRKRKSFRQSIKEESESDTSTSSDSDSDIPLDELRKEMKSESKAGKKYEKPDNADGPRLCPICGKLFKARQNFNSHMTTVHRKKLKKPDKMSFLCPDCGRVISGTRQNFVAHRRYHHSDKAQVKKRFTCDICPKKFYMEKNLIIHQRIHKGEKGYICEICPDKSYTQIGGLILHMRKVHLKKPTCTCNYCGKQFYEKHYLETHIRQWHTGERPFSCEICGKAFSCNGTLLRHRKDSHGEKRPCPKCGKMYTEGELRKHLKRHKIREEGIKRKKYTCEYCGTEMNFTSRKRHLLKQHGIMLRGRGETAERVPISRADAM